MRFVSSAVAAVAVSSLPVLANAASLDIGAAGYELVAGSDRSLTITADGTGIDGGSLLFGGLLVFESTTISSLESFDVSVAAEYALAFDADGTFADSAEASFGASEVSLMDGMIEVLFETFSGTGVYAGVDALLVTYSNQNLINAAGGFDDFFDGPGDTSTLRVQGLNSIAPIPLPAGLPLLLGGLACFAVARGRKKSQA